MQASDWKDGRELLAYLRRHTVVPVNGWFGNPGQLFAGTPGLTVGRIRREARLGARVTGLLSEQPAKLNALERVEEVRKQLATDAEFKDALTARHSDEAVRRARIAAVCLSVDPFILKNLSVAAWSGGAAICSVFGRGRGHFGGRALESSRCCGDGPLERLLGCIPVVRDRCGHRLSAIAARGRQRLAGGTRASRAPRMPPCSSARISAVTRRTT